MSIGDIRAQKAHHAVMEAIYKWDGEARGIAGRANVPMTFAVAPASTPLDSRAWGAQRIAIIGNEPLRQFALATIAAFNLTMMADPDGTLALVPAQ